MCGTVMIAREALRVSPGSRGWLYVHQELSAGHCGEIIVIHANQKITFPFIVVEVDREKNGYKTVGDPDAAGHDLSSSWLQSGIAHSKAGQHEEAIRDFSGIATEDTDPDGGAHNLRGDEYLALGDYQRAIADYDYVLRWRPHDRWARNNRAAAYANLHDYPRAIADFQYEIRINPNDEYAIETLAKARRDMAAQSASNLTCYIGSWHDNIGEPWIFSQRGELLHLYRPLDGSEGTLNWTGNEWRGSVSLPHMHWNAEIMLRSSDDSCTRLNTDSAMYFVRVPANGG